MLSLTPELILLDSEPGLFAFYIWQNVMIVCWSKQATGPAVERLARSREKIGGEHLEGVSVIHLIANGAGLPTSEARSGVKELLARYSHQRACVAVVVQGEGFWAGAMRGAITGVRMLVPLQFPMRIFSAADEVVEWLPEQHGRRTGVRIAPDQLLALLRRLVVAL